MKRLSSYRPIAQRANRPSPWRQSHRRSQIQAGKLDGQIAAQLRLLFEARSNESLFIHNLSRLVTEQEIIDIAYGSIRLTHEERRFLFHHLPSLEDQVTYLLAVESHSMADIVKHMEDDLLLTIFAQVSPQQIIRILQELPEPRKQKIREQLNDTLRQKLASIEKYEANHAGRLMSCEFFSFNMESSVSTVITFIRDHPEVDLATNVLITNHQNKLQGCVPLRTILVTDETRQMRQLVRPIHHKVTPFTSQEELLSIFERYSPPLVPVVDEKNRLLGVINNAQVIDLWEETIGETMSLFAGTDKEPVTNASVLSRVFSRAPWLLVTALGGVCNSFLQSYFRSASLSGSDWFDRVIIFLAMINGLSGNIGLQSSTVLVRGLSTGMLLTTNRLVIMMYEIVTGVFSSFLFASGCASIIWFSTHFHILTIDTTPTRAAGVVGIGMLGAGLNATVLGVVSPFLFNRFGVDPAIASGPIVTAFNDILSMITFFVLVQLTWLWW